MDTGATILDTMDIFISWHGRRGNATAAALQDWLPEIANAFTPWFSSSTDKGSRWRTEVAKRLEQAKAGIIILTPSALTSPWLLFEAGAIAKDSEKTYACTLLLDLKSEDVTDPLAQFQHTKAKDPDEMLKLVKTLNEALGKEKRPEAQIERSFQKWWPDLEEKLKRLPPDETAAPPPRNPNEMLAQILETARRTEAQIADLALDAATSRMESTRNRVRNEDLITLNRLLGNVQVSDPEAAVVRQTASYRNAIRHLPHHPKETKSGNDTDKKTKDKPDKK